MASPTSPTPTIAMPTPVPPDPLTTSPGTTGLRVRLFAGLREAAGWDERLVSWNEAGTAASQDAGAGDVTPRSLWHQLQLGSVALPAGLRVAVNHAFAHPEQPLQPGDEVAFLPPISGG